VPLQQLELQKWKMRIHHYLHTQSSIESSSKEKDRQCKRRLQVIQEQQKWCFIQEQRTIEFFTRRTRNKLLWLITR
jgi:hypothetical protein